MDLYSQGASISQANQLTEAAREANNAAKDFNNTLAAKLDEANDELDATASEQQAINMYQGISSGGKLVGLAAGTKTAKKAATAVKDTLKSGATAGGEVIDKFKYRKLAAAAENEGGAGFLAAGGELADAAADEAEQFGGELTQTEEDLRTTREFRPDASTINESVEGAAQQGRRGIQTSQGVLGGEAAVEGEADAVRTGRFADLAGPGAKAVKGETEAALDAALKGGAKLGAAEFAKTAVAGVGAGLDIYKDIQSGFKFDNWKQEVGNIGNIVGSALEIGGALTAWTGLGVGAEALGAAISVGSTAFETAGDIQATGVQREKQESDIMSERRGGAAAAAQTTVVGRSN